MNKLTNFNFELDNIPLGTFWNALDDDEAPNRYQYEMIITKFLGQK